MSEVSDIFEIKETKNTPAVIFNSINNDFSITGKSFPENAKKFYGPILDWLEDFQTDKPLKVSFSLYYISSSSIIALLEVIRIMKKFDKNITIDWYYEEEDEDIEKIGEDYQQICEMRINLIAH